MDDESEQLKSIFGSSSTLDSLIKVHKREANKSMPKTRRKTKNAKPEKEVVSELILKTAEIHWDMSVIEAKGVYSQSAGCYLGGQVEAGYADMSGNMQDGRAVYIEAKAPGKRATLKSHQREFLTRKIHSNCFACCSDGWLHLSDLYRKWLNLKISGDLAGQERLLLSDLPRPSKKAQKDSGLSDDVDLSLAGL